MFGDFLSSENSAELTFSCILLAPDAMALFNVCSDLKRVCYTLPDVTKRLPSDVSLKSALAP